MAAILCQQDLIGLDLATLVEDCQGDGYGHKQITRILFDLIEKGSLDLLDGTSISLLRYLMTEDASNCGDVSHFARAMFHLKKKDKQKFERVYDLAVRSILVFGRRDEIVPSECLVLCVGTNEAYKDLIHASLVRTISMLSTHQKDFLMAVGGPAARWLRNWGYNSKVKLKVDHGPLSNKKLNVAVLYSGRPFNLNAHVTSHMLGMMGISEQHRVDNYCVLWEQDRDFAGSLTNLLRPAQVRVLPMPLVPSEVMEKLSSISEGRRQFTDGMVPMMVGMQAAFTAFESMCQDLGRKYDLVVRMRYDLAFGFKIQNYVLAHAIAGYLCVPSRFNYHGVNDQLGIGTPEIIKTYMSAIKNLVRICDEITAVNPEMVMEEHLRKEKVNRYHFDQDYRLVRHWQTHLSYEELSVHDESSFSKSRRLGYVMHYE